MYNEWGYIEKDANTVQQNIDRNFVYAHMDQVIEELLARTREHLLDTRRDFQTKIDFYYDSKPVQKIGTAMRGIDKVLRQRFL
jgi:malate synthase